MLTLDLIHRNKIIRLSLVLEFMVQDLKFSYSAVIVFHLFWWVLGQFWAIWVDNDAINGPKSQYFETLT